MRPGAVGRPDREHGLAAAAVKSMTAPPGGRYDDSPVHRLDSHARLAPDAPMSTNRIPALSVRLARLALEVDELAQEIIAEPLSERDELWLAAPTAHLAIGLEWLHEALYECERLDLRHSWARVLRDARKESDHAHPEDHPDPRPGVSRESPGASGNVLAPLTA
jgi:hypothetical protein